MAEISLVLNSHICSEKGGRSRKQVSIAQKRSSAHYLDAALFTYYCHTPLDAPEHNDLSNTSMPIGDVRSVMAKHSINGLLAWAYPFAHCNLHLLDGAAVVS